MQLSALDPQGISMLDYYSLSNTIKNYSLNLKINHTVEEKSTNTVHNVAIVNTFVDCQ